MPNLMLISENEQDAQLADFIAEAQGYRLLRTTSVVEIQAALAGTPDWLIIYDGGLRALMRTLTELLPKYLKPSKIFILTDGSLQKNPHLLRAPIFSHHIQRSFELPAPALYSRLFANSVYLKLNGLTPFFQTPGPDGTGGASIKSLFLKNSSQKHAAIEAIQNTLTGLGIAPRLSKAAAQATDELIMNALFDAPRDAQGKRVRHRESRDASFSLSPAEEVEIQFAAGSGYVGICVIDLFGTLERSRLFTSLRAHLQADPADAVATGAAGFGLHGIMRMGLGLALLCNPLHRTEAMIFFPISGDYKRFRSGFKFMSLLSSD